MTSAATQPLVELRGVTFGYRRESVVDHVDLAIRAHDFLALVGPNGGGKTTLLKLMLGCFPPWRGEVVRRLSRRRGAIGYVPQFSSFDRDFPLRVESLVLMGRLGASGLFLPYRREDRRRAAEALATLRLSDLARLPIGELSGGEVQRVLIARALAGDPEVLLLDEPTSSVDPGSREVLASVLAAVNTRIPVVVVTHDISSLARQVTRVAFVNRTLTELVPDTRRGDGAAADTRAPGALPEAAAWHLHAETAAGTPGWRAREEGS